MNDYPDLVGLLCGEVSDADVTEVADHLDCCGECRRDLAETAVGHTLLTGATRTLSRPARLELPEVPPLKSPTSSPRGPAWQRPRPWRVPSGSPTWSRSTATGLAAW